MGTHKDKLIKEEDDWERIAHEKGYLCSVCGNVIPKSEYEADESMCGWCRHQAEKD